MLWVGSESINVYLGPGRIGVGVSGQPEQWMEVSTEVALWGCIGAAVEAAAGGQRRFRKPQVSVWLSGEIARPCLVEASGVRSRQEMLTVARSLAPQICRMPGPCDVWLDAWAPDRSCLTVVCLRSWLEGINTVAQQQRWSLRGIRPWWSAALDVALKRDREPTLLVVQEEASITLLGTDEDTWVVATTASPVSGPSLQRALIQRAAIACNATDPDVMKIGMASALVSPDGVDKAEVAGFEAFMECGA